MPIWYVGRLVAGRPNIVFGRVREAVQYLHLNQRVPFARFSSRQEVVPRTANRRGRHVFFAVEARNIDEADAFAESIWRVAQSFAPSVTERLELGDRLRSVNANTIPLQVDNEIWHFTRGTYAEGSPQATFRVPTVPTKPDKDAGDPLGSHETDTLASPPQEADPTAVLLGAPQLTSAIDAGACERHQRLLLWVSAAGRGSWEVFARVSNQLGTSIDGVTARRVMRRLALLGHVESDPDGRNWSATPAALVQLATDPTRAFCCGQRSEQLRRRLEQLWPLAAPDPQVGNDGAPRWVVNVGKVRDPGVLLKARGLPFRWEGPAADNLVQHLPALDRWQQLLPRVGPLTPPEHVQRWHAGAYRDEARFRITEGRPQGLTGLYRLFYENDKSTFDLTGFFDADKGEFLRGDWYGLRFLAGRQAGLLCPARWLTHQGRSVLLVPLARRWPLLYERALALASGLLPIHDGARLCYLDVPFDIVSTLAKLLGVTLL